MQLLHDTVWNYAKSHQILFYQWHNY